MRVRRIVAVSAALGVFALALWAASGPSVRSLSSGIQAMPEFQGAEILYGCGVGGESWSYRWKEEPPVKLLQEKLSRAGWLVKSRTSEEVSLTITKGLLWPTEGYAILRARGAVGEPHAVFLILKS